MAHLEKHIKNFDLNNDNTLHVIGVITNPVRWNSRIRLFREWKSRMLNYPNVRLHVVEGVLGDRKPECSPEFGENYEYMQVKISSEIWIKENLINIGVKNLFPSNWKYMAWVDCDVKFHDDNWALGAIHQLQHYNVIQPWSQCSDLDFHGGISQMFNSFGFLCANGKLMHHGNKAGGPYSYAHTGFAVACTRYFWENSGIMEWCIIGSGDHHFLWSCIGKIQETVHSGVNDGYRLACELFERKAKWASSGIVGYLHGRIDHYFHGHKIDRQYWSRWKIILENDYDPLRDLVKDSQGVVHYIGKNKEKLEHLVMRYNRDRKEDAV